MKDLELAFNRDLGTLKSYLIIEVLRGCLLRHAGLDLGQKINLSGLIVCRGCGVGIVSPSELALPQGILDPLQSQFEVFLTHLVVHILRGLLLLDWYLE